MFSLCRLCGTCTDPMDLVTEMSELESKLVHCFGWRRSEKEHQMPKKACNFCVDRLQQSYDFVDCMLSAEKQLNKLLSEQVQTVAEDFPPLTAEIKVEDIKKRIIDVRSPEESGSCIIDDNEVDEKENILGADFNNDSFDFGDDYGQDDDSDDAVFGEPFEFPDDSKKKSSNKNSNKNSTKKVSKKRTKKKRPTSDPFLAAVDMEDRLDGGLISTNGVKKLEKLFPIMTTMSWEDCQYKCEKCDRIFKGSTNLYSHIRSVHIEEVLSIMIPCFYCDSKHRREFTLNRHIATDHFTHLKYRCPSCADYFWDVRELKKHRSMHSEVQYTCEICTQKYTSREAFYGHCSSHLTKRKIVDTDEKFICDICQKNFKTKQSIRTHLLLHTDKYDHICEICGWKFQSKGNLQGHLASTHSREKPFKCDKCNKFFKTRPQLKHHRLIHEENYVPHVCQYCSASFRRKSTLVVHLRSHTNFCPYTCKFCGKKFRHGITLQTHERSHTNTKPYGCPICEYRCTSKGNLNKHMMRAHSIDFRNQALKRDTQE